LGDKFLRGQKDVMLSFVVTEGLYSASTLFYEILESQNLILKQIQDDVTESEPDSE
jgi:hypothetical protein